MQEKISGTNVPLPAGCKGLAAQEVVPYNQSDDGEVKNWDVRATIGCAGINNGQRRTLGHCLVGNEQGAQGHINNAAVDAGSAAVNVCVTCPLSPYGEPHTGGVPLLYRTDEMPA